MQPHLLRQLRMLWSSPLFWIAFAVFLFWALGAYNRLMRLRSAVVQSFGSFAGGFAWRVRGGADSTAR